MSLFTKLFEAVHSWRRRRGGHKSRKRSDLAMEQLDHRQLLAVNFTGNVPADFLATQTPGVVVIPSPTTPPLNQRPIIPPVLQGVVSVSGFEIDQLRVNYDSTADILSVGLEGPPNGRTNQQVIAGDSDNNGNSATVDPKVAALEPGFTDPADMGGTKTYGITLDLNNPTVPDIAAGFPQHNPTNDPLAIKPYEVAKYLNTPGGDMFDNANIFPQYTGNYYLANDPNHPNFELQIAHFSQLYQQVTGKALTPQTTFGIGAFGSNNQDIGISDEFFPPQVVSVAAATTPPPTPPPPPPPPPPPVMICSPTVFVNPHENNHINTAHPSPIRVNVLGSSGFDPTTIIPSTVRFGDPATINVDGALPILAFEKNVNHDQFPDETFVFNSLDVKLPPGITSAVIEGETTSGSIFISAVKVFNRDSSFYSTADLNKQQAAWLKYDIQHGIDTSNGPVAPPVVVPKAAHQLAASMAIDDLYAPFAGAKVPKQVNATVGNAEAASASPPPPVVVSIPTRHGKGPKGKAVTLTGVTLGTPRIPSTASVLSGAG
jgi:hypothetical protein